MAENQEDNQASARSTPEERKSRLSLGIGILACALVLLGLGIFAWQSKSVDVPLIQQEVDATGDGSDASVADEAKSDTGQPAGADVERCVQLFNGQGGARSQARLVVRNGSSKATVVATPSGYCQVVLIASYDVFVLETSEYYPDLFQSPPSGEFGGDGVEPISETPPILRRANAFIDFTSGRLTLSPNLGDQVIGQAAAPQGLPPQTGDAKVAEVPYDAGAIFSIKAGQTCPPGFTYSPAGEIDPNFPTCGVPGD